MSVRLPKIKIGTCYNLRSGPKAGNKRNEHPSDGACSDIKQVGEAISKRGESPSQPHSPTIFPDLPDCSCDYNSYRSNREGSWKYINAGHYCSLAMDRLKIQRHVVKRGPYDKTMDEVTQIGNGGGSTLHHSCSNERIRRKSVVPDDECDQSNG